ncbi:hypothetical protein [Aeoliella mucimassa]|uniref:Uncharacterized protein n=1 Tax=Aeoliella mucimassa TaxID=2527972 RepID=A0A518ARM4_9BACT|nr:hypothetical protein [Aeoliella mucimassa]QDU57366.1 hypothetical protein Pan181_35810 [Aeoliella mucimassa]
MSTHLGNSLLEELSHRGLRGMYFDYAGYQALRSLATVEQVQQFLDTNGYASVLATEDPVWIADGLEEAKEDQAIPWSAAFDIASFIVFPLWLLGRLRPKRRVFPSRVQRMPGHRR